MVPAASFVRGDDWVLDCATWQGTDPNHGTTHWFDWQTVPRQWIWNQWPLLSERTRVFSSRMLRPSRTRHRCPQSTFEFVDQGVSSAIVSSILVHGVAGVITCRRYAQQPPYTEDDIAFLERLAERAALGLLD